MSCQSSSSIFASQLANEFYPNLGKVFLLFCGQLAAVIAFMFIEHESN
jgi:hypothetical protein